jgi:diguanylate cyclase (GGDEF)-like protein
VARSFWRAVPALALALAGAAHADTREAVREVVSIEHPIDLTGTWLFRPGDDASWADPKLDDSGWTLLQVPRSWGRQGFAAVHGLAWYRLRLRLAPGIPRDGLGITLGKIDSAYDAFAGGVRLGGVGSLPPEPRMEYDRHQTYAVPRSAMDENGDLVVALRVWRAPGKAAGAGGPVEGPYYFGRMTDLVRRETASEIPDLVLATVYLMAGLYHLWFFPQRRDLKEYLWFGLVAVLAAGYCVLRTQWKYELGIDFLPLKKLEHAILYLIPVCLVQFLWPALGRRIGWPGRVFQVAMLGVGATVILAPGLDLALRVLPWMQVCFFALTAWALVHLFGALRARQPEAAPLFVGFGLVVVTLGHDALVERGVLVGPRLGIFGFAALVGAMGLGLGHRFQRAFSDLQDLRRDLERRVAERTAELERRSQELAVAHGRMEDLAMHDPLTGLLNRRSAYACAEQELQRARRTGRHVAVALLDVDHFKAINDEFGHGVGDEALRAVAERAQGALRAHDRLGRWGGEEFLAVLSEAGPGEAERVGERLREAIGHVPLELEDGRNIPISVSVGIAVSAPEVDGPVEALVKRADEALYVAKREGRNRVKIAV